MRALDVTTRRASFSPRPCGISLGTYRRERFLPQRRREHRIRGKRSATNPKYGPRYTIVSRVQVTHVIPQESTVFTAGVLLISLFRSRKRTRASTHTSIREIVVYIRAYVIPRAIVPMHLFVASHLVASSTRTCAARTDARKKRRALMGGEKKR